MSHQPSWIGYSLNGRYKLEEMLGQGGMATVYKAMDPNLRRVVAVKLIHSHLSNNEDFVRRFEEEAAAVAQLNHPNIVKVYDFDHDDGTYYMVLEFIPGESLNHLLRRLNKSGRRLPLDDVLDIAASTCDAVDYAHRHNMLHRDIKPANVMLTTDGRAVLMDFGVVKMVGEQTHTVTGAVLGTALYMSPEQARGERPDERSDIYSLGITLYEIISGKPPFEADSTMSTLMMHVYDPVPDIRELNPDTPDGLKAIIERALEKDPARRYQSAGEMAAALRAVKLRLRQEEAGATIVEEPEMPTALEETLPPPVEMVEPEETFIVPPAPEPESAAPPPPREEPAPAPPAAAPRMPDTRPADPARLQAREEAAAPAAAPPAAQPSDRRTVPVLAIAGGSLVALALIVVVGLFVLLPRLGGGGAGDGDGTDVPGAAALGGAAGLGDGEGEQAGAVPGEGGEAAMAAPTEAPTATDEPTLMPTEAPPTETPTPDYTPTPTDPAGLYIRITDITLEGSTYLVYYEAFGYEPVLPGQHIHFFFDTVAPENAGHPGTGPWYLWGGPNPFNGYTTGDRPAEAMQMCALVANPDHSIYEFGTGNCVDLPMP